jgi:hypothetical protein
MRARAEPCLGVASHGTVPVRAELVEALRLRCEWVSSHCVRVVGRDMRPAAHSLSFASPKESKQRKGDPITAPSLREGSLRSERLEGVVRELAPPAAALGHAHEVRGGSALRAPPSSHSALRRLQTGPLTIRRFALNEMRKGAARPWPRGQTDESGKPLDRGTPRTNLFRQPVVGERGEAPSLPGAKRHLVRLYSGPVWRRRRSVGLRAGARSAHPPLTSCECPSAVSEANGASSRTTALKTMLRRGVFATAKTAGTGPPFFAYFLSGKRKKVGAPPGAYPGRRPSRSEKNPLQRTSKGLRQAQPERRLAPLAQARLTCSA